jgi:hypothetical protein
LRKNNPENLMVSKCRRSELGKEAEKKAEKPSSLSGENRILLIQFFVRAVRNPPILPGQCRIQFFA